MARTGGVLPNLAFSSLLMVIIVIKNSFSYKYLYSLKKSDGSRKVKSLSHLASSTYPVPFFFIVVQ
jgi:hypothetical protein